MLIVSSKFLKGNYMRKVQLLFSILLSVIFLLVGCVPRLVQNENPPSKIDSEETIYPTEVIPTATQNPLSTEPQQEAQETAMPIIETLQPENNMFTYALDQKKIDQFCLEAPQIHILTPLFLGDYYMATVLEQRNLSSVSTVDATISLLHPTEFPNGHPGGWVEIAYPWYTYGISELPSGLGDWNLHLVNLKDGTNTIIGNRELYNSTALHTYISLQSNTLYLSASTFDGFEILTSRLYAIDLATKKSTLIIDSQDKDTFMSFISASNGYIVIENDPPKSDVGRYLTLFDLSTNTWRDLPQTYPASVPSMEYPYIVWKNNNRFETPTSLTIFNIETGESIVREVVGTFSFDLSISSGYVITEASTGKDPSRNSVVMYSLENGDTYAIQIGINEVSANGAYIDNGNVIWAFTTIANADNYSSYICKLPLEEVFSNSVEGIEVLH